MFNPYIIAIQRATTVQVIARCNRLLTLTHKITEEDNLEEIDPSNVLSGPRTRQKDIDFAKAAQNLPAEEDDEEDDEEFVPEDEEMEE